MLIEVSLQSLSNLAFVFFVVPTCNKEKKILLVQVASELRAGFNSRRRAMFVPLSSLSLNAMEVKGLALSSKRSKRSPYVRQNRGILFKKLTPFYTWNVLLLPFLPLHLCPLGLGLLFELVLLVDWLSFTSLFVPVSL